MRANIGLTFASMLRSLVRSDPDIIMVGEIRDFETALVATEASLTGHLVLSTLHTNDAPTAVTRLAEMGIPAYLIASGLELIVAQRLARRLCPKCMETVDLSDPRINQVERDFLGAVEVSTSIGRAVGCTRCYGTGYSGRIGLYEVLPVTRDIRETDPEPRHGRGHPRSRRPDGCQVDSGGRPPEGPSGHHHGR